MPSPWSDVLDIDWGDELRKAAASASVCRAEPTALCWLLGELCVVSSPDPVEEVPALGEDSPWGMYGSRWWSEGQCSGEYASESSSELSVAMGEKKDTGELSNDGGEVEWGGWVPEGPGKFQDMSGCSPGRCERLMSVEDVGGSMDVEEEEPMSCQ